MIEAEAKEISEIGKEVLRIESETIHGLIGKIQVSFTSAVSSIVSCDGVIVVTGMGKTGIIAQKISATFASTGTPSIFLHPAEAAHGDLGRIRSNDLVLALSNSGETQEILRLIEPIKSMGLRLVSICAQANSSLGKVSDVVLEIGNITEACPIGLAPTASTTAILAMGDALCMAVLSQRKFQQEDFFRYHPAGNLGRGLTKVRDIMRKGEMLPLAKVHSSLKQVVEVMGATKGRPGAALIVDENQKLLGLFTDGDLRRMITDNQHDFSVSIEKVMKKNPKTIFEEQMVSEARHLFHEFKVDQIPVIDTNNKAVGLLDVQELISLQAIG